MVRSTGANPIKNPLPKPPRFWSGLKEAVAICTPSTYLPQSCRESLRDSDSVTIVRPGCYVVQSLTANPAHQDIGNTPGDTLGGQKEAPKIEEFTGGIAKIQTVAVQATTLEPKLLGAGGVENTLLDVIYGRFMTTGVPVTISSDKPPGTIIFDFGYGTDIMSDAAKFWIMSHKRYSGNIDIQFIMSGADMIRGLILVGIYPYKKSTYTQNDLETFSCQIVPLQQVATETFTLGFNSNYRYFWQKGVVPSEMPNAYDSGEVTDDKAALMQFRIVGMVYQAMENPFDNPNFQVQMSFRTKLAHNFRAVLPDMDWIKSVISPIRSTIACTTASILPKFLQMFNEKNLSDVLAIVNRDYLKVDKQLMRVVLDGIFYPALQPRWTPAAQILVSPMAAYQDSSLSSSVTEAYSVDLRNSTITRQVGITVKSNITVETANLHATWNQTPAPSNDINTEIGKYDDSPNYNIVKTDGGRVQATMDGTTLQITTKRNKAWPQETVAEGYGHTDSYTTTRFDVRGNVNSPAYSCNFVYSRGVLPAGWSIVLDDNLAVRYDDVINWINDNVESLNSQGTYCVVGNTLMDFKLSIEGDIAADAVYDRQWFENEFGLPLPSDPQPFATVAHHVIGEFNASRTLSRENVRVIRVIHSGGTCEFIFWETINDLSEFDHIARTEIPSSLNVVNPGYMPPDYQKGQSFVTGKWSDFGVRNISWTGTGGVEMPTVITWKQIHPLIVQITKCDNLLLTTPLQSYLNSFYKLPSGHFQLSFTYAGIPTVEGLYQLPSGCYPTLNQSMIDLMADSVCDGECVDFNLVDPATLAVVIHVRYNPRTQCFYVNAGQQNISPYLFYEGDVGRLMIQQASIKPLTSALIETNFGGWTDRFVSADATVAMKRLSGKNVLTSRVRPVEAVQQLQAWTSILGGLLSGVGGGLGQVAAYGQQNALQSSLFAQQSKMQEFAAELQKELQANNIDLQKYLQDNSQEFKWKTQQSQQDFGQLMQEALFGQQTKMQGANFEQQVNMAYLNKALQGMSSTAAPTYRPASGTGPADVFTADKLSNMLGNTATQNSTEQVTPVDPLSSASVPDNPTSTYATPVGSEIASNYGTAGSGASTATLPTSVPSASSNFTPTSGTASSVAS